MAEAYGLNDTTHTSDAAFFDYDNDGDLDMFLIVNEMDEEKLPNRFRARLVDGSSERTDRLYRNDWNEELGHPVFTDVSDEAGILIEGFSLGVNITDINRDGWKDIFITNDYLTNDIFYINQGDGTFVDQSHDFFRHTSHSAMGNDIVDLNNDGLPEVIAVDMLPEDNFRKKTMLGSNNYTSYINNKRYGYQFQYVRNTLQLNQGLDPISGKSIFSEMAMLAGVSATDWSWAPVIADFDNDGDRDMIITNGFPKDVTDRDFVDYFADTYRFVSKKDLLKEIPSVKLKNYAYLNQGDATFSDVTTEWGITEPSFSNGAAYVDLDNDGDLDYVVNNIDDPVSIYQNLTIENEIPNANWLRVKLKGDKLNPNAIGANVEIFYEDEGYQAWEYSPYRGYLSSVELVAHFGLEAKQSVNTVRITWPDGSIQEEKQVAANQVIEIEKGKGNQVDIDPIKRPTLLTDITDQSGIDFIHQESDYIDFNVQRLLPHKLSQYGPGLSVGDINGDDLDDFYIGGSHFHRGSFFVQSQDGTFKEEVLFDKINEADTLTEELGTLLFDADNDGDLDLYLVSGGYEFDISDTTYQDRLFVNENGKFKLDKNALPEFLSSGSCVKASDYDKDGDLDLFVGGRVLPNAYPKPVNSFILENKSSNGKVSFVFSEANQLLENKGLVCDALWTDYDNDGWQDLILAGEWMPLIILKNESGKLVDKTKESGIEGKLGWWNSLVSGDFDKDGDIDYLAGNLGLNTLNKANEKEPLRIYADDFDGNGGYDILPTVYWERGEGNKNKAEFPFFGRADYAKQMVVVKSTFPKHADYGRATIQEILPVDKRKNALILRANHLSSSYIENKGNGQFEIHPLPIETQLAPVFGMIADDINGDGNLDAVLIGNDYGNEVSQGRMDALPGLVLLGNGKGQFHTLPLSESGFLVPGDGKALAKMRDKAGNSLLLASQNQGALKLFKTSSELSETVAIQPNEISALVTLTDGTSYRIEFHYGEGFLSQSSRFITINDKIKSLVIKNTSGESREITF